MTNLQDLKDLALHAARGTAPENFSNMEVNESLRAEVNALASDYNSFRRNKLDIFEIIQTTADVVVPNRIMASMGQFAEVKQVANGQRVSFKRKVGAARAKSFITRAAVSGIYETFRLDTETFDITPLAYGGAAYIDFERFLSGDETISDYMTIIVDGLAESVFVEVQAALQASVNAVRPTSTVYSNTYSADKLFGLINTVKAYGNDAVIFASSEFVGSMGADAVTVGATNWANAEDLKSIHDSGYVTIFRGTPIVRLAQSFTDETNLVKQISPGYAYIFPTGKAKVVQIVLEGGTIVNDFTNRDNSMEIQAYKKFGVGITTYHNWAVYYNSSLT